MILSSFHNLYPNHPLFSPDFVNEMFKLFGAPDDKERQEQVSFFNAYIPIHPEQKELILGKVEALIQSHLQVRSKPFQVSVALRILLKLCRSTADQPRYMEITHRIVLRLLHDPFLDFLQAHVLDLLEYYTTDHPERDILVVCDALEKWPKACTPRESVLLAVLFEYVPRLKATNLERYLPQLFRILAKTCNSPSLQICQLSFSWFLSNEFDELMLSQTEMMLDILLPALTKCSVEHWESSYRERALLSLSIMEKFDPRSFQRVRDRPILAPSFAKQRSGWATVFRAVPGETDAKLAELEAMLSRAHSSNSTT
jgi:hypothetical protein